MSRRRRAERREILPDAKFGDLVLAKFMNYLMYEGKKSVAEGIIYGAFDILAPSASRTRWKPSTRPRNVSPAARSPLPPRRRRHLSGAGRSAPGPPPRAGHPLAHQRRARRGENTMTEKLAGELLDASNNRGTAVKKREDTHKMAEANRASRTIAGKPTPYDAFRRGRFEVNRPRRCSGSQLTSHFYRRAYACPVSTRSKTTATSASWPTSMPARPRRPSGSSITPAEP